MSEGPFRDPAQLSQVMKLILRVDGGEYGEIRYINSNFFHKRRNKRLNPLGVMVK